MGWRFPAPPHPSTENPHPAPNRVQGGVQGGPSQPCPVPLSSLHLSYSFIFDYGDNDPKKREREKKDIICLSETIFAMYQNKN